MIGRILAALALAGGLSLAQPVQAQILLGETSVTLTTKVT